ncbi:MAG: hypothetical protein R3D66_04235 [Alphaproteobacteria bacterium]
MSHDEQKRGTPDLLAAIQAAAGTCNETWSSGFSLPLRPSPVEPISEAEAEKFLTKLTTHTDLNMPKPDDF